MPKKLTELTDGEREEAKAKVRALAQESPSLLVVEVEIERPHDRRVKSESSRAEGKWRLIRCMEHWTQNRLCDAELEELSKSADKKAALDPTSRKKISPKEAAKRYLDRVAGETSAKGDAP